MEIFTYPPTARPPSSVEEAMLKLAQPLIHLARSRMVDTSTGAHLFFSEATCLTVHPPQPTKRIHPLLGLLNRLAGRRPSARRLLWFQSEVKGRRAPYESMLIWESNGDWTVWRDGAVLEAGVLPPIQSPKWLGLLNAAGVPDAFIPTAWVAAQELFK